MTWRRIPGNPHWEFNDDSANGKYGNMNVVAGIRTDGINQVYARVRRVGDSSDSNIGEIAATFHNAKAGVIGVQQSSFYLSQPVSGPAEPTYSVTAPASIDEGSAGTMNVSTTNVSNGTTLYWTVTTPSGGDFSTASGNFTINSNAGSFTVTPDADSTTEGSETGTIEIRTGSISGTIVATDTFTINDTSVPTVEIDYLVVAGGGAGGGGTYHGAGGGAGGYRTGSAFELSFGVTYTVTIGAGASATAEGDAGANGSNSLISGTGVSITSSGGGGGGNYSAYLTNDTSTKFGNGKDGGSGGGSSRSTGGGVGDPGLGNDGGYSPSEGNDGGIGQDAPLYYRSGGGGGAGSAGSNGGGGTQGNGGDGVTSNIEGPAVTYAGGGGGGAFDTSGGSGGSGVGGAGGTTGNGFAGTVNTGGGGGGARSHVGATGGAGGSGIVIIKTLETATATTGSPTTTIFGGYNIYKFTGSGSITF